MKRYVIYVDILGFDQLASEMATKKGIDSDHIRTVIKTVIKERVSLLETSGKITGKNYGEAGDLLLFTDNARKLFDIIKNILEHRTPYGDFRQIPLEISIDLEEYEQKTKTNKNGNVDQVTTSKLKKPPVIEMYHAWYKEKNKNNTNSTFIVITEPVQHELEFLNQRMFIPVKRKNTQFFVADIDILQKRAKLFEFLDKIGHSDNIWYNTLDNLYIHPLEYQDIEKSLNEQRVVFITGKQEFGKTYTAIKMMWDYYLLGYEPKWIENQEEYERAIVKEKLQGIRSELKPHTIVYFKDLFSKTRYKNRESLVREIEAIVDCVNQVKDTFVIVTPTEEIFQKFEKEKVQHKESIDFENKLNIKKLSYDYEKRIAMVIQWAEKENCKWVQNNELTDIVLEDMKDLNFLPTPLNIWEFAHHTNNITEPSRLKEKLKEKSAETEIAFSKEIESMSEDKAIFLLFPFIGNFNVQFIKPVYHQFMEELGLKTAGDFDCVLDWFKNDRGKITNKCVEFSHFSYYMAVKHLLSKDGYNIGSKKPLFKKKRIFEMLLLKLAENEVVGKYVAHAISCNFHILSEDTRNKLLICLAENKEAAGYVGEIIAANFDVVNKDVKKLLIKLAENEKAARYIAWAIGQNFNKIPEDKKNKLLLKIAEKGRAAGYVSRTIMLNFDKLPDTIRNQLLLMLANKDDATWYIDEIIADNFDMISEDIRNQLLLKLAEKDDTAWFVNDIITDNFDNIPENVRNQLLCKLSENDHAARDIARLTVDNFNKLPEKVRNQLLSKLAEKDHAAGDIARVIVDNFDSLPENARNELLIKLAEKDEALGDVAEAISDNFDKLPENVRNMLFKLAEKDDASAHVAWAITNNYDNIPDDIRNKLLFKLAEKNKAAWHVAQAVTRNFDKLPGDIRNQLLFKLTEKDNATEDVAKVIAHKYYLLPMDVRNLLFKLIEKDHAATNIIRIIGEHFDNLPEHIRNELILKSRKFAMSN